MRTTDMAPDVTESEARNLLPALEAISTATIGASRDAERHAMRLRFALARVGELRTRATAVGGVFEPARLEVAQSILQTHQRRARSFAKAIGIAEPRLAQRPPARVIRVSDEESVLDEQAA